MDLDLSLKQLFNPELSGCEGCSLLGKLPRNCINDYELKKPTDILFISDYLKMMEGDYLPFRGNEWNLIRRTLNNIGYTGNFNCAASVKCPLSKSDDIKTKDKKICNKHLVSTIQALKPKLVFACGSLATNMFFGKNTDLSGKRGQACDMELGGHSFKLVPIFHPYQAIAEPKNVYLFNLDIKLNVESILLGAKKESKFSYIPIFSISDLQEHWAEFTDTDQPISNDIETTGFNFLSDLINSTSFSILDPDTLEPKKTIVMPIDHKAAMCSPKFKSAVCEFAQEVFSNPRNRKIGQNFKFDMRFWFRYGVTDFKNVIDTKILQHFYSEEVPKSLSDLVAYYFPHEV